MAAIVSRIEIARPQDEVFSYVTDPSTFAEWQAGVVAGADRFTGQQGGTESLGTQIHIETVRHPSSVEADDRGGR